MKVYVDTSFKAKARARLVMQKLRQAGHEIVGDWTMHRSTRNFQVLAREALKDWQGVRDADVLVVLWDRRLYNGLVELGIALGLNKYVFIVGRPNMTKLLYAHHPYVTIVPTLADLPILNGAWRNNNGS